MEPILRIVLKAHYRKEIPFLEKKNLSLKCYTTIAIAFFFLQNGINKFYKHFLKIIFFLHIYRDIYINIYIDISEYRRRKSSTILKMITLQIIIQIASKSNKKNLKKSNRINVIQENN